MGETISLDDYTTLPGKSGVTPPLFPYASHRLPLAVPVLRKGPSIRVLSGRPAPSLRHLYYRESFFLMRRNFAGELTNLFKLYPASHGATN